MSHDNNKDEFDEDPLDITFQNTYDTKEKLNKEPVQLTDVCRCQLFIVQDKKSTEKRLAKHLSFLQIEDANDSYFSFWKLKTQRHDNIVKIENIFVEHDNQPKPNTYSSHVYIITERCSEKLIEYLKEQAETQVTTDSPKLSPALSLPGQKSMAEDVVLNMLAQLASGMAFLHGVNYVGKVGYLNSECIFMRDLYGSNVFFYFTGFQNVLLTWHGHKRHLYQHLQPFVRFIFVPVTNVGYVAPELRSMGQNAQNTPKGEVWALGIIFFDILMSYVRAIFLQILISKNTVDRDIVFDTIDESYASKLKTTIGMLEKQYSTKVTSLLLRMVELEPDQRCTMKDIVDKIKQYAQDKEREKEMEQKAKQRRSRTKSLVESLFASKAPENVPAVGVSEASPPSSPVITLSLDNVSPTQDAKLSPHNTPDYKPRKKSFLQMIGENFTIPTMKSPRQGSPAAGEKNKGQQLSPRSILEKTAQQIAQQVQQQVSQTQQPASIFSENVKDATIKFNAVQMEEETKLVNNKDITTIIKHGILKKQSEIMLFWNERDYYLVTQKNGDFVAVFLYYEKDKKFHGKIRLSSGDAVVAKEEVIAGQQFTFAVQTNESPYIFAAKTMEERTEWVNAISDAVKERRITTAKSFIAKHKPTYEMIVNELRFYQIIMYKSVRKSEHIGVGSFGEVHKVFVKKPDLSEDIMAMKHIPAMLDIKDLAPLFIKDMKTMSSLSHPNLLQFQSICIEKEHVCVFMEYFSAKNMDSLLCEELPPSWKELCSIMVQLADALKYLHTKQLIHKRIKPENILIGAKGHIYLSDCGSLFSQLRNIIHQCVDIPNTSAWKYYALERLEHNSSLLESEEHATFATDAFSFGLIIWQLLNHAPNLFIDAENVSDLIKYHKNQKITMVKQRMEDAPEHEWTKVVQLMFACLEHEPEKRPTMDDVFHTLKKVQKLSN